MKELILNTVTDLVSDFVHYDRREDEELPLGSIEAAVRDGSVTVEELAEHFKAELILRLN